MGNREKEKSCEDMCAAIVDRSMPQMTWSRYTRVCSAQKLSAAKTRSGLDCSILHAKYFSAGCIELGGL